MISFTAMAAESEGINIVGEVSVQSEVAIYSDLQISSNVKGKGSFNVVAKDKKIKVRVAKVDNCIKICTADAQNVDFKSENIHIKIEPIQRIEIVHFAKRTSIQKGLLKIAKENPIAKDKKIEKKNTKKLEPNNYTLTSEFELGWVDLQTNYILENQEENLARIIYRYISKAPKGPIKDLIKPPVNFLS